MSDLRITARKSFKSLFFFLLAGTSLSAQADITWSGVYRTEGLKIENSELDAVRRDKAYILHHLVLQPRIVAADGLTIHGRFDVLNNGTYGQNNQVGEFMGNGPRTNTTPQGSTTNSGNSNVEGQAAQSDLIAVTQLYLQWVQEFGSLVVGRMPLQFGLGITHNAGTGMFDHYFDVEDIVGYKFVLGNLFIMPMLGKMDEGSPDIEDDVNDYMVHVQYDNPETDLALGVFYRSRVATRSGNDAPANGGGGAGAGGLYGGNGSAATQDYTAQHLNLFVSRKLGNFGIGVEAGFNSGRTGVTNAVGEVGLNGFGIAGELSYKPETSKWNGGLKFGMASGDDPGTTDVYEGFVFDRNYDVAFMLFNHRLGQFDPFRTELVRNTTLNASRDVDSEAISNVRYLAPYFNHRFRDNFSWGSRFTTAFLITEPIANGSTGDSVGYELDLNLTYKPFERLTWTSEAGILFPGDAFKGNNNQYEAKFGYGVITKAAITF